MFENQRILITGGTGSFGSSFLPVLLENKVEEVRIFSRDEEKQLELKRLYPDPRIHFFLGDVRDYNRVLEVCKGVSIVYHVAAQKVIGSCEENPTEALQTNSIGTLNVKKACIKNNVNIAVFLSTDKAVKPINFYGMTKAVAERLWLHKRIQSSTKFVVVRYGNIIASRGSVVPFFKKLIAEKKSLPITHQKMTRFLLTLGQAHKLVIKATFGGKDGEIVVPNIPACEIVTLAKAMAGEKYPLNIVGIRQGEKIHECLIQEYEMLKTKKVNDYFVIQKTATGVNGLDFKEYTSDRVDILSKREIQELLAEAGL